MSVNKALADLIKLPASNTLTNGGLDTEAINDTNAHDPAVWIDMANYHEAIALFVCHATNGTTDALSCAVTQATDSAGTSAKVLSGAGYAAATIAAGNSDYIQKVRVTSDMLDRTNAFQYIGARITAAGSTDTFSVTTFILLLRPRHADATLPD